MAKPVSRIKARSLRRKGKSVKEIAEDLSVSKSTVSYWVRDIILSVSQLERLKKRRIVGSERGRLKGSLKQKRERLLRISRGRKLGFARFKNFSSEEFFVAGLSLYWAEGSKKTREVRFCNSDPSMLTFMINWFQKYFNIKTKDIKVVVGINEVHRSREEEIKAYWSETLKIPAAQFRKVSFKKTKNKKVYKNINRHFGTATIVILKPARIYYKILGYIEGLAGQRSSVGRALDS